MNTKGLKLIGKGAFTKVYALNDNEVLIKSSCTNKMCMSEQPIDDNSVFPTLTMIDKGVYTCKYYPKFKSLKTALSPKYYEIYRDLKNISKGFSKMQNELNFDALMRSFQFIKDEEYKEQLIDYLYDLSDWGMDMWFEISPRNVAVDNGKLILLDVFFFKSDLDRVEKERIKRQQIYFDREMEKFAKKCQIGGIKFK